MKPGAPVAPPAVRGRLAGRLRQLAPAVLTLVVLVILWEVLGKAFGLRQVIAPLPSAVLAEIGAKWTHLPRHAVVTVTEVLAAFFVSAALGIGGGILIVASRFLSQVFMPLILSLQVVPKIAIAPLLLIWFGFGPLGKVVIALTVAFFPVLVNTISGLHSASPEILDLARSLHASKVDLFRKVLFPNALPYIFTGLKISMTLSVVGAVIGEFIGGNQGLGYLIQQAQFDINTPLMVAAILLLAVIGISAYGLVALAERLCVRWGVKEAGREILELVDARL
jgi:NitT/TauT family transport system permease protein